MISSQCLGFLPARSGLPPWRGEIGDMGKTFLQRFVSTGMVALVPGAAAPGIALAGAASTQTATIGYTAEAGRQRPDDIDREILKKELSPSC